MVEVDAMVASMCSFVVSCGVKMFRLLFAIMFSIFYFYTKSGLGLRL